MPGRFTALTAGPARIDPTLRARPLTEARRLYEAVAADKTGCVLHVTGKPEMGKTTFLATLAASLSDIKPRPAIIAGRFARDGMLSGWTLPDRAFDAELALTGLGQVLSTTAAAAALLTSAGAAPLSVAAAAFVGQAAQAGGFAEQARKRGRPGQQLPHNLGPEELMYAIRHANQGDRPVVAIIDDFLFGRPPLDWSALFLTHLLGPSLKGTPVFFVLTASTGPDGDEAASEVDFSNALRDLTEEANVARIELQSVAAHDLGFYAQDVAQDLISVTAGHPGWIARYALDWRHSGSVFWENSASRWRYTPGSRPEPTASVQDRVHAAVYRACEGGEIAVDTGLRLLALASLEGSVFTADAIAAALSIDADTVIDWLDDRLMAPESPVGLDFVVHAGFEEVPPGPDCPARTLNLYRFTTQLIRGAFHPAFNDRLWPNAKDTRSGGRTLIEALIEVHNGRVGAIALKASLIARDTGDMKAAAGYERFLDVDGSEGKYRMIFAKEFQRYTDAQKRGKTWNDRRKTSSGRRILRSASTLIGRSQNKAESISLRWALLLMESIEQSSPVWHEAKKLELEILNELALFSQLNDADGDHAIYLMRRLRAAQALGEEPNARNCLVALFETLSMLMKYVDQPPSPLLETHFRMEVVPRYNHSDRIPPELAFLQVKSLADLDGQAISALHELFDLAAQDAIAETSVERRASLLAQYRHAKATREFSRQNWPAAVAELQKVLEAVPANERVNAAAIEGGLAAALIEMGNRGEAVAHCKKAIHLVGGAGIHSRLPAYFSLYAQCFEGTDDEELTIKALGYCLIACYLYGDFVLAMAAWLRASAALQRADRPKDQPALCVAMAEALSGRHGRNAGLSEESVAHFMHVSREEASRALAVAASAHQRETALDTIERLFGVGSPDMHAFVAFEDSDDG